MRIHLSRECALVAVIAVLAAASPADAQWAANGTIVCGEPGDQDKQIAVTDGAGGVIVAWRDDRSGSRDVYAQRVSADGYLLWAADGVPIHAGAGVQNYPAIATDGAGGAIIAWQDDRGGTDAVYAQRIDGGGNLLWAAGGVLVCPSAYDQTLPAIAADGSGGAMLAWIDEYYYYDILYQELRAQRIAADGEVLWPPQGVLIDGPSEEIDFEIAADGTGGLLAAWISGNLLDAEIKSQRLGAAGQVLWAPGGVILAESASGVSLSDPHVVTDGTGGAIVGYQTEEEYCTYHFFAARIAAGGSLLWTTPALDHSGNPGADYNMCEDEAGGAYFAWRGGEWPEYRPRVQRVDPDGALLFPAGGVPICPVDDSMSQFTMIAPDGEGGALVCWERCGYELSVIIAQRVNGNGECQWTPEGVRVAGFMSYFVSPPVADGQGGAILLWEDDRFGDEDVFALRVYEDGHCVNPTGTGTPPACPCVSSYPNPFNPRTTLAYTVPRRGRVRIRVFDLSGRLLREVVDAVHEPGRYERVFDAGGLPSGVYPCLVSMPGHVLTRRLVLLK
ncbi:MAG: T9SS type A sorting domain-containing protein [Candidatus Krumholzibacteriota bacterium]|nr:T9SS type A sorting domain-containing protein [Candidatus Krumholzibacteriota bacterium]